VKAFICRWSNGGVSVVTASSEAGAQLYLDHVIADVAIESIEECPAQVVVTVRKSGRVDNNWSNVSPLLNGAGQ
jgi:hypothetical protein